MGIGAQLAVSIRTPGKEGLKQKNPPMSTDGAHNRIRTGDLFLTKEVLYLLSYVGLNPDRPAENDNLERETGLEPATLSLEG